MFESFSLSIYILLRKFKSIYILRLLFNSRIIQSTLLKERKRHRSDRLIIKIQISCTYPKTFFGEVWTSPYPEIEMNKRFNLLLTYLLPRQILELPIIRRKNINILRNSLAKRFLGIYIYIGKDFIV